MSSNLHKHGIPLEFSGPSVRSSEPLFTEALQYRDPAERATFLDRACGRDGPLRETVEALLRADNQLDSFRDAPSEVCEAASRACSKISVATEKSGDRVGRYELREKIGEGGCGVVYVAEQVEPVRRKVALKFIKVGMNVRSVVARFEGERQALAMMDHPNIAHIFDGGTTESGRPYFVMELVHGIKVTDYCDQNSLTLTARLELFIDICQGVQHAHQKGIIHCDIKPSNILITTDTFGKAVPKIIDFGIAKATTESLTDKTLSTDFGLLIGTPNYMSPEQAASSGLDVDTRVDVFGLGVLLYELLTGGPPLDPRELFKAGLEEIRRLIRDQDPARPSLRLSMMSVEKLAKVSAHRDAQPSKLIREVRGDLDWIVMKALEKDRARRFHTAGSLALDVQRYLANEAISARPHTSVYLFRKLVWRHRVVFASSFSIFVALLASLIVSIWQTGEAKRAERLATREAAKSEKVAEFLKDMLTGMQSSVAQTGDAAKLRKILDGTVVRLNQDFRGQPDLQAELLDTAAKIYWAMGEFSKAEGILRRSLDIERNVDQMETAAFASSSESLAVILQAQGKLAEAELMERRSLAIRRKLLGNQHPQVAISLNNLAVTLQAQRKFVEAEESFREALTLTSMQRAGGRDTAIALENLGCVLYTEGKLEEAETIYREALAIEQKTFGADHPYVAELYENFASVLHDRGELVEAEAVLRKSLDIRGRVLGAEHPDVFRSLYDLANLLREQRKFGEAESFIRECLTTRGKVSSDDWQTYDARSLLGAILLEQGKLSEAEPFIRSGYEGMEQRKELIPDSAKTHFGQAGERLDALNKAQKLHECSPQTKQILNETKAAIQDTNATQVTKRR